MGLEASVADLMLEEGVSGKAAGPWGLLEEEGSAWDLQRNSPGSLHSSD